ncbi:MAG TPA: glycosyl hydrolase family 25 [Candidatus Flavonifractor merdigallinarum]|uniref:Lysozyme n=1 Tax=Candidatus Flavonifractor merdigallinarum TaxID=2838589 RepID=A0A9D2BXB4_9FIRM|nr:glycosyl hydrolase family 25 [Candidatus Flavonifractor merdigallinarum]
MRKLLRLLLGLCLAVTLVVLLGAAGIAVLRWRGLILGPDQRDPQEWEVFGVDVSTYQGKVDWPVLARQGVDFAFIKATEGSSLRDVRFAENWAGAQAAGVRPGAYHFFSYDSPGETQAENFIATVPVTEGALPPVVDLEFYGDYLEEPADAEHTRAILDPLLAALEERYGVKPILYCTYRSYQLYLDCEAYRDYPLWISSPEVAPLLHDWDFWQYSHTARMEGYDGHQDRIDLNVFRGSRADFQTFGLLNAGS